MSWQDQGRKEHGWFGDGTAPQTVKDASAGGGDGPDGLARRIQGVVHGAVAALPAALRRRAEAQLDGGGLSRLSEAMTAWSRGAGLGKAEWAERMLGRDAGDRVAGMLHVAALGAASGSSHAEGRQASEALAGAMQVVGLDHWPRFVADAQAQASIQDKAGDDFAAGPGGLAPVPFVDDTGHVVLNNKGLPIMRPAGMDPHFFVEQGLADREKEQAMVLSDIEGGGTGVLGYLFAKLDKFNRGNAWDAQRLDGPFRDEFIDYATVIIGLYAAATGLSRAQILFIENIVAILSSYKTKEPMDETYIFLRKRNVLNTDLGYTLYQSGRIGVSSKLPSGK